MQVLPNTWQTTNSYFNLLEKASFGKPFYIILIMQTLKLALYEKLEQLINHRISIANENISAAKISQENDTKSTAGDKHETGRAMLHLEQENNQKQLAKAFQLKKDIQQIDISHPHKIINRGSLIITKQATYFISVGLGKLHVNQEVVYAISLASPIGQMLFGKKAGDTFKFQGKTIQIETVA